jgi:5-methylcytosine-specific restriction endonuclease McrA
MEHGANGYTRGCRCDECRSGHADYMREYGRRNAERINAQRRARRAAASPERQTELRRLNRIRDERWRKAHPEHARELSRKHSQEHRDRDRDAFNAKARVWNKAARERYPEKYREWARQNRVRARARLGDEAYSARRAAYNRKHRSKDATKLLRRVECARRRARERGAAGWFTRAQMLARVAYFGYRCWMCGGAWESIDHVIPLAKGGSNWPANLRPACQPCNARKSDRKDVMR